MIRRSLTAFVLLLVVTGCAVRRGVQHEIKAGQTLWRISRVYNVKLDTLLKTNDIKDPKRLDPGTTIVIPGASEIQDVPVTPQRTVKRTEGSEQGSTNPSPPSSSRDPSSSSQPSDETRSSPEAENTTADPSQTPDDSQASSPSASESDSGMSEARASNYFDPVWPCEGRLASRFNRDKFPTHRGIRIHTSEGSLVRAAEKGNIQLAGTFEGMPGLGKIVIIFHSHDFQTVYAHLKELKVSEGEAVDRDQPIGVAGSTGDVNRPMCYFEIRYKVEPRDPLIFLGERS